MTTDPRADTLTQRRALLRRMLAAQDADAPRTPASSAEPMPGGPSEVAGSVGSTESMSEVAGGAPGSPPLSSGQRRMWSLQQLDPNTTGYNVRIALDLTGSVRVDALVAAVDAVVARHDILRTTYQVEADGQLGQVVHPVLRPVFDVRDLTDLPAGERSARAGALCAALGSTPFDLATDSPLRVGLYTTGVDATGASELTLLVVAHHIAWDDSTSEIFFAELVAFYRDGDAARLSPPNQYAAVVATGAGVDAGSAAGSAGGAYWRDVLAPLPDPLVLPELTGLEAAGGTDQSRTLRPGLAAQVRAVGRAQGASSFMVLLAAVTDLVHRYTGASDVVVGVPVVNRDFAGAGRVIGYLGNTIPLRMRITPQDTFATLLARARAVCLDGYAHQDVDLDDIARAVDPDRTRGDAGLFSVVLSLRSGVLEPLRGLGLSATRRHVPGQDARFDLTLAVETDGDDLSVEANHPATARGRELVAGLLGQLDRQLAAATADPDVPLAELVTLEAAEHDLLLRGWNDTFTTPATDTFPRLFAAQVAATPQATAVLHDGGRLTYAELARRAHRLTRLLVRRGAGAETTVALAVPRSVEMVVAVLAVAASGAAYVPVDPDYPADRVRHMLTDSQPNLLLTTAAAAAGLPAVPGLATIRLDDPEIRAELEAQPERDGDAADTAPHPDHPVYVIYTSGSTGAPKGVVITHRALANHLVWAVRRFPGLAGHTLMHSSISFDFTVTPLLATLVCGGAVELCVDSPDAISHAVGAATFLKITPSHLPLLPSVRFAEHGPRTLVIAGEELRIEALDQWHDLAASGITVINEYGPTETTVGSLLHPVEAHAIAAGAVPVGSPVDNTTCYLLDGALRPVPVGVPGELYIGGGQVARGYLNRPGLTAARFVADPFGDTPGGRLYRTGDLMRRLPSGALRFLGRVDEQVKIRGFRVELGEIESVLLGLPGVAQATVAARADGPGGRYLAAYVVPETVPEATAGAGLDLVALRAGLAAVLPEHMVPATVTLLDALPLSPSGKVDRKALPAPRFGGDPRVGAPGGADPAEGAPSAAETGGDAAAADGPAGRAQELLLGLFAEVLGGAAVGLDQSFFELGGDSIVAISLVGRARKVGLRFTPRDVFAHRTVRALARKATFEDTGTSPGAAGDDTRGVGPVPATPIMRAFAERGPLAAGHRMSVLVETPAAVSVAGEAVLGQALQALLDRHDALRARLRVDDLDDPATVSLEIAPVGTVRATDVLRRVAGSTGEETAAARVARARAAATAELAPRDGRMLRAIWFDAGPDRTGRLLLVAHHLVVDGVSWRILVEDLAAAWQAAADGRAPALPAVATSLRTWSNGLARAAEQRRAGETPLWRDLLTGPDPLLGRRRVEPDTDVWATTRTVTVTLDTEIAEPVLTSVPALFFAGVEDVLLAALALALADWGAGRGTPLRSTLVLVEGHGRQEAAVPGSDLSRTVGWFTSQHPVRLDTTGVDIADALAGGAGAGTIVKAVKESLRALPDHGIGFGLLRHLHPEARRELAALPEPQLGFNYLGRFDATGGTDVGGGTGGTGGSDGAGGFRLVAGGLDAAYGPDMALPAGLVVNAVTEDGPAGPRLVAHWMYADGLFSEASVTDLADRWCAALRALVRHGAGDGAGGRSPSDLSLVALDQGQLDALEAMWRNA
ncbi:amino acid adenylation domain-containing protein [Frankia sp. AgPm24]|uniref:non-ribosomal peptide synthetase n=1 Tax=Frankia sp. AgPm24 TaxID=631128 RepID=UPI00200C7FC5|nr:non-ribosomal peptide synthetase [Frankia sp. AgPm24]MCK9923687.1 amino acid adenylation domain-containing protein [Frankia sp. AgPm24]